MVNVEPGKLDDLSMQIGRLIEGQQSIDRYTHQHAHDVANLAAKLDGGIHGITKQLGEVESRMNRRMEDMANQLRSEATAQIAALTTQLATANVKIAILESADQRRQGALSVGGWLLKSPFVSGLVGAVMALIAAVYARSKGL